MTPRQQRFAEYYAESGNAAQSAIKAGYSEQYANGRAYELLENVGIASYIQAISAKNRQERILSAVERQELLSDLARDGSLEPKDRINAIDKLNKMTGEYTLKVDAAVNPSPKLEDVFAQVGGKGLSDGD
ncbi:MAG: terminase small subunit [Clostridiales bacterium]|nr:terminase small subunit [Clostridiales bacterium]MCC8074623.1 terminase small subunit [Clostridiales bacterium]MCC8100052.1 terminase small subunit [Clostridiales bacterium]